MITTERKNKKGMFGILFFFIVLFSILILGFIAIMTMSIIDYGSDTITPIMNEMGVIGDTNVTEASTYSFGLVDNFIQISPWLIAFAYVLALIFSIVMVMGYNYNPNPAFIGLYIALILLLILGSIIISNAYEDIYSGTDEISSRLQEQTAMSYLILYSPFIMCLIAFITGIFLFAGNRDVGGGI